MQARSVFCSWLGLGLQRHRGGYFGHRHSLCAAGEQAEHEVRRSVIKVGSFGEPVSIEMEGAHRQW